MSTRTTKSGRAQSPAATSGKKAGGKKGRKPIAPVRVGKDRNWGPIVLFTVVGLVAAGIIGWAAWAVVSDKGWEERAADIEGVVELREKYPPGQEHVGGVLEYEESPPVGGPHNAAWQNCNGEVYDAPIANEHAVHSLEHGAVWITYGQNLPPEQVDQLADRVRGNEKMMMSPYEGLESPISLQAWGYQLAVDSADDPRIGEFITTLRVNASLEGPTARCDGGVGTTGTTPVS